MAEPYVDIVQFRAGAAAPNHPIPFELERTPFLKYAKNAREKGLSMKIAAIGGGEVGMRALTDEALSFYGSADRFALVGDCRKPATVEQAMRSAFAVSHSV